MDSFLRTSRQAAEFLGLFNARGEPNEQALAHMRLQGTGPTFIRVGRLVRYRPEDLADFVKSNSYASTRRRAQSEARP